MKLFLSLFFSLTFMVCNSQNEKPNREAFKLNIAVNLKQDYGMEVTQTPYFVKSKILQIYPGEKVLIEAEIKADSIFSMKSVKENLHPEKTIEVEFLQDAKDRNNISMFLNVKNPFDKTLKHDALMYTVEGGQWEKTSIIPIRPKLQNFETWGYAIITLVLDNWRLE